MKLTQDPLCFHRFHFRCHRSQHLLLSQTLQFFTRHHLDRELNNEKMLDDIDFDKKSQHGCGR